MGIDHRGFDVFVAQKFLDGADVIAVLEQVGGEAVAKGVRPHRFDDAGLLSGFAHRFLLPLSVDQMKAFGYNRSRGYSCHQCILDYTTRYPSA